MMDADARPGVFVRMFGSAVLMQAVLSATNLLVGLILIRRTTSEQYGYYVLTLTVIMLLNGLQSAFIQPQLITRMTGATVQESADLVGGLCRDQRYPWLLLPIVTLLVGIDFLTTHLLPSGLGWVLIAATAAVAASLHRDFFRMVLLAYRRPVEVLRADAVYAALLIVGVLMATLSPAPAAVAAASLACAAIVGGALSSRSLWHLAPWNKSATGVIRNIAPLGAVTAAGAAIHWLFSQGYNFLVAWTLDVPAVAAIAAIRILIMPVNLVSTGIGTLMLPTISAWLQFRPAGAVLRRLLLIVSALTAGALCYFALLWLLRDWVFTNLIKKQVAQRDPLLLLWFGVGILMLLRDQLVYLLVARSRYHALTLLTLTCALLALTTSYFGMKLIGVTGALLGVLIGEAVNVTGLLLMSSVEARKPSGVVVTHAG